MLQSQPLTSYVHCTAHCSNLIASAVCLSSQVVYKSIQLVNEFGVLCNASGKFKSIFVHIASDSDEGPVKNIKPLWPSRWLVGLSSLQSAIRQYKTILQSLAETSGYSNEVRMRAAGLSNKFQHGNTLMCLVMATKVIEPLECLNRALQT